jgi:diacylglycerol kinase family enzyme
LTAGREPNRPTAGERLSAVGALLALVVSAGLALVGVAVHLLAILVVTAGLLICVTGCWYAVSRRGLIRMISLLIVVATLGGTIAGLFFAGIRWYLVVLIAALAAGSVLAARHALRRTDQALRADAARLARAGQPEHPVLIMNPKSGGGKVERFQLVLECRKRGIEPILLKPGDDLRELAEDAVRRGADVLGMAGGDGSQALVASVAARADLDYVCVPAGTRNHFALDLGLDRADVVGALDAYADALERHIDLAEVNGRTFVNNASLGLYAQVVQAPEYRDAKLRTAAAVLPGLLGPDARPLDLCFTGPDGAEHDTAHLILVSNNPYQLVPTGGGVGTRERIDGGALGVVTVMITDAAQASQFLALQAAGQARRFSGWDEWAAPGFEIRSAAPVPVGVDGEALIMEPPLIFTSRPAALRVRLPRRTLRRSPAARTVHVLSRSTLTSLARVAAGVTPGSAGPGSAGDRSRLAPAPPSPMP